MPFVKQESSYRENAKPPYDWFLFIPLGRKSSAKGYGQIQDPVWQEYKKARGGFLKSRADTEDVLDFIGWYNDKSHRQLGISKWNAKQLYLAYHEGHGGYRRGSFEKKPDLVRVAGQANDVQTTVGAVLLTLSLMYRLSVLVSVGEELNDVLSRRAGVVQASISVGERARSLRDRTTK